MRVGIYANKSNPSSSGGIVHALLALLKAFDQYSDKADEFIVFGPADGAEWLAPALSDKIRLIKPVGLQGGAAWHKFHRWKTRFERFLANRPRINRYFIPPANGYSKQSSYAQTLLPSISTGVIEEQDLDVIHFPYQDFIVTSLPSVFNPHDLQHRHLPKMWSAESIFERELYYRFACNCASKVAVAFPWVAEDLVESFGLARKRIALVPWGGPSAFSPRATPDRVSAVRGRYGLPESFAYYPAIPWPHKNHANLLRCMKILKDQGSRLRLVLSGGENPFNRSSWKSLRELIVSLGLGETVKIIGYVATEDMRAVYSASSIVVVPTLFEAGSGPVAEAWADDIPVACSDRPMLRSQAEDAAIYFDPLSPVSIASALECLTNDRPLRAKLIAAGQRRSAYYSWEKTAHGYLQVYRELAASQPRL